MTCSDGFGGVERYIAALGRGLATRGVDVTVIGGRASSMRAVLDGACMFAEAATMREAREAMAACGPFDVVNTHMTEADLVGLRARSRAAVISTRHFSAPRGGNPVLRAVFAAWSRRFAAQISISQCVAEAIGEASAVVRTGVQNTDAAAGGPRDRTVVMVQRLEPEKATDVGLRAWAQSTARDAGWRLLIVGDGSQRAALEQQAEREEVSGSVTFLGHRDDAESLMEKAGMLLAPTPREGLGLSVIEAMARALPVVATAAGGHLETAGAVTADFLFAPGDAAGAAQIIDRLASDDDARTGYAARLQQHQREALTTDTWVDGTLEVFEGAVTSR